jgi:hypothetical protein
VTAGLANADKSVIRMGIADHADAGESRHDEARVVVAAVHLGQSVYRASLVGSMGPPVDRRQRLHRQRHAHSDPQAGGGDLGVSRIVEPVRFRHRLIMTWAEPRFAARHPHLLGMQLPVRGGLR